MNPTTLLQLHSVVKISCILKQKLRQFGSANPNQIVLEAILWSKIKKFTFNKYGCYNIVCWTKDDKLEGPFKQWYENKVLVEESHFVNGRFDGRFKSWFNDGTICNDIFYKNGEWYIPITLPLSSSQ